MKVLLDHHMKRPGVLIWSLLEHQGWLELLEIPMLTFADVGLPIDVNDRDIWRFAQKNRLILLTANRNNDGEDSLQQTIWDENQPTSLPVVTIGVLDRVEESTYRKQCAEKLVEIVMDIENYLGAGRIYIP